MSCMGTGSVTVASAAVSIGSVYGSRAASGAILASCPDGSMISCMVGRVASGIPAGVVTGHATSSAEPMYEGRSRVMSASAIPSVARAFGVAGPFHG